MIVMIITMMEVFAFLAKRMMSGVNITEPNNVGADAQSNGLREGDGVFLDKSIDAGQRRRRR